MRAIFLIPLFFASASLGAEFAAPDATYRFAVPDGWRAKYSPLMTVLEPANGGEARIMIGSGISAAKNMDEFTRQAAQLTGQMFPGARLTAGPKINGNVAEQEYANGPYSGWNGMQLQGEVYFAVLVIGRAPELAQWQSLGRGILQSAKFQAPARNPGAEQALVGRWEFSDYKSSRPSPRESSSSSQNWTVVFEPGNRFRSSKSFWVDVNSAIYSGGGTASSTQEATGTYRIHGSTLVADIDGYGRYLFLCEPYGNGGVKLNGQLFLRQ
jgi:hypothetical protein